MGVGLPVKAGGLLDCGRSEAVPGWKEPGQRGAAGCQSQPSCQVPVDFVPDQRDRGQEPTSQDAWGHHVPGAPRLSVVLKDCRVEVAGLGGRAGTGERKKCALHGEIGFWGRAAGEIKMPGSTRTLDKQQKPF